MRAKFDLYISRHIIGRLQRQTGLSTADVLQVLSRRFMTRCCSICAVLLVIAADLDVTSQYLEPYLPIFVPFVNALPLDGYATMEIGRASCRGRVGTSVAIAVGAGP